MKKLLLHICCAPCSTYVIEILKDRYDLALFFYNPNVEPLEEHEARLRSAKRYALAKGIPLIEGAYDNDAWHRDVKGHESDPEGGERCSICFNHRLKTTAEAAKEEGFDIFATTLTISPHKNKDIINRIGKGFEKEHDIQFLESDFKKKDGFLKSIRMSKEHDLYRQSYCGCLYSKKL